MLLDPVIKLPMIFMMVIVKNMYKDLASKMFIAVLFSHLKHKKSWETIQVLH
jgi:hypothetical protein